MQINFLTNSAEERKDEDTKMEIIFLMKPVDESKDKETMEQINILRSLHMCRKRTGSIRTP